MFRKICLIGIISLITLSIFANQISYADDIDKIQPSWTEDLVDWWLEETISNIEFVQVLTYLTNNEIIKINISSYFVFCTFTWNFHSSKC